MYQSCNTNYQQTSEDVYSFKNNPQRKARQIDNPEYSNLDRHWIPGSWHTTLCACFLELCASRIENKKNLFDRSAQFQILTRALGCNHVLVFKNTTTTPRFVSLVMNQMIGSISYRRGGNSICPSFMNKTVSSPTTPAREHYSEWGKGFLQHDFHTSGTRCMKVPNVWP